jgi:hypothetical protein
MTVLNAAERTLIGKALGRVGLKLSGYHLFMGVINLLALGLSAWDAKGLVLLVFTLGYSLNLHLRYQLLQQTRLTNELLEELLEQGGPLRPLS